MGGRGFYPRPPDGGRPCAMVSPSDQICISIHALRMEGDGAFDFSYILDYLLFLSTPSGWRATTGTILSCRDGLISIHALRVEGDRRRRKKRRELCRFLSTPSGWRATCTPLHACSQLPVFLSTPSGWRATAAGGRAGDNINISIHALRVEGDGVFRRFTGVFRRFLSTPSGWRATLQLLRL